MTAAADPRWGCFIRGFDPDGRPLPMTREVLVELSSEWEELLPADTPEGERALLAQSRSLFIGSWHHYEHMVTGCLVALQAVEAAFRHIAYPAASAKVPLKKLVTRAANEGLLSEREHEQVKAGVGLRNSLAHPDRQSAWTLGMVDPVVRVSHQVVADLVGRCSAAARP